MKIRALRPVVIIFTISFVLFFSLSLQGQSTTKAKKNYTEDEKIEYLIKSIENLNSAQFCRNGTYYDAEVAANHLRMKREKAGSAVKTARVFIDKIASESSVSGVPYRIKFTNGKEVETRIFLNEKLKELENN